MTSLSSSVFLRAFRYAEQRQIAAEARGTECERPNESEGEKERKHMWSITQQNEWKNRFSTVWTWTRAPTFKMNTFYDYDIFGFFRFWFFFRCGCCCCYLHQLLLLFTFFCSIVETNADQEVVCVIENRRDLSVSIFTFRLGSRRSTRFFWCHCKIQRVFFSS